MANYQQSHFHGIFEIISPEYMTCNYESEYITDYDKKNEKEVNFKICHYIMNLI